MAPQVSVLVPTVRPTEIGPCVEAIRAASVGLAIQIVVVADFARPSDINADGSIGFTGRDVLWIMQTTRHGPIAAIDLAEDCATGDYLFLISDEDRMHEGAIATLYAEAERCRAAGEDVILFPDPGATWSYYGRMFPPWPFVHRDLVKKLGGLLDPAYGAHYADPDLGMRAWTHGVTVRCLKEATIHHHNNACAVSNYNRETWYQRDMATFRARWDHLGTFNENASA